MLQQLHYPAAHSFLSAKGKRRFSVCDFDTLKNSFWIAKKPDKNRAFLRSTLFCTP